jgi:hypothetical protein
MVKTEDKTHTNFKVLKSYAEFMQLETMVKEYARRQAVYYQDALVISQDSDKSLDLEID